MICPDCGNLLAHNSYFNALYCPRCGGVFKAKRPMINADRIRAMSDEEMAECLYQIGYDNGWGDKAFALEWLQQPYKEVDHA